MPDVPYRKTPKGEEEIAHRAHRLVPRARSLLIMVNGSLAGDELQRRSVSLGGGVALFEMLVEQGFIEPAEAAIGVADAVVAKPSAPQFGLAYVEAARFASHFIVDVLGPAYDELGARVETCRDPVKLVALLEGIREVVEGNAGKKKAEVFWAGVKARLP
jgi:hypothetical protein